MPKIKKPKAQPRLSAFLFQGLVLCLPLDEGGGLVAKDISGFGNDGTLNGALAWQGGQSGWCVGGFAGGATTTTYIDCGNSASMNPTTAITLAAWIYYTGSGAGANWIIGRDDNVLGRSYAFGVAGPLGMPGNIQLQIGGSSLVVGGLGVAVNAWSHVAISGDAAHGYSTYVNGALSTTAAWSAPPVTTGNTNVGRRTFAGNQNGYQGAIDFPLIYSKYMAQEEIALMAHDTFSIVRQAQQGKSLVTPAVVPSKGGWFDMRLPYGIGMRRRRGRR